MDVERYRALLAQLRAIDRSSSENGLYPPATDEQIQETEQAIGFTLPPALRMLYQEVGNGGAIFGNGCLLNGVIGGFPQREGWRCSFTIDTVTSRNTWRLNERVERALRLYQGVYIECEDYPDRFIQIADVVCQMAVELDGWTGVLYAGVCGQSVHEYYARQGLPPPPDSENLDMQQFSFLAPSLEEWLDFMLHDGWSAHYRFESRPLELWMLDNVEDS